MFSQQYRPSSKVFIIFTSYNFFFLTFLTDGLVELLVMVHVVMVVVGLVLRVGLVRIRRRSEQGETVFVGKRGLGWDWSGNGEGKRNVMVHAIIFTVILGVVVVL